MTEPVLSVVLLNDAEELRTWSRKNFGRDFLELFKICERCERPFGFHCKDGDRCPTSKYDFRRSVPIKADEFETEQGFILDKKMTRFFMAYLALLGVNFR